MSDKPGKTPPLPQSAAPSLASLGNGQEPLAELLAGMRVAIGLTNPKSPANVGAVLRAAGCYGAQGVCYTGERFARAARFHTDTQGANHQIPLLQVETYSAPLPAGMAKVCVELVEGATPLPAFEHPECALYVFGPEDGSLRQQLVDSADAVVYMPTRGSMNLAASVNVLLYDRAAKAFNASPADERAQILAARDVNNRLRVKS
ncbi:RNA methyltransferase [Simiduia sp. 21SJ11W-1]|uniref:RNA methyltransferase n=1 Tax=Simiduia sp. 21SJ11W-1 TaxID=2909669 RepID=UPI0020A23390|nr:RNA methyltransferase [Simiduia sp. 21SJ11W-1]UTA47797.1 RNA methyltransferase [Simiduia sp. 21SJ11W-1]